MNNRQTFWLSVASCVGLLATASHAQVVSGVRGGLRYDNWWAAAGLPAPQGTHPLYPPAGQQSGPITWQCNECHGWDYKGVDGVYGSGPHFTGIRGVFGSTLSAQEMFDLIRDNHGYQGTGMSDQDVWDLVAFLQQYLVDTSTYIDANGVFLGDSDEGRYGYLGAHAPFECASCHGAQSVPLQTLAFDDPWQFMHKTRISNAGATLMPSGLLFGDLPQRAADIGDYLQADYPSPAFVGDQTCAACHTDFPSQGFFDGYMRSGHPWKIFRTAGQQPGAATWPHTPVPPLPVVNGTALQWPDVEYVIGNYFWKTRYIDRDGFIHTGMPGETTQWNIATQSWVPYNAGTVRPFNCGRCHTTGYSTEGNQHGLPGLIGTWAQDGVRCEACHGPAQDHAAYPLEMLPPGGKDCADCHYRDSQFRMPWRSGFMRHHQQGEDLSHSPHDANLTCASCHEPHRSTVYADGGVHTECTDCHAGSAANNFYVVRGMESVECIDCHMPYMAKSAVAFNDHKADVRGHLFRIMRAPTPAAQNVYQVGSNQYWNQDQFGESFITLDYACLGCHTEIGVPMTIQQASHYAGGIHERSNAVCYPDCNGDGSLNLADLGCFQTKFAVGDPYADCNADGVLNLADFGCFQTRFALGCP